MTRLLTSIILLFALSSMQACQYYGVHFTQGNVLTQASLQKLHTGMTQQEVLSLLGTPVYENSFSTTRWVYVYTTQIKRVRTSKKVILTFREGRVSRIER